MLETQTTRRKRIASWMLKLRGEDRAIDRAKFLIDNASRDEALRFLTHSSEVFASSNQLKFEAAAFLYHMQEFPMAVEWLRRGGIVGLDEPTVFEWSAGIEQSGNRDLAIELLMLHVAREDHAADHDPSETHFHIARLFRIQGDVESAVENVSHCLESGNYPNILSMVCTMRGERECKMLLERVDGFKAVADLPGHFGVRLNFAISDIYKHNGDYRNSAIHLGKARDESEIDGQCLSEGRPLKPSFLVIGTMKSGTTGFYHTLCQHPQVFQSIRKEVRYFGDPNATEDWYFAHFPRLPESQFGITGEATPNYYAMNIHDRIEQTLPGVKLICLMRDPATRAISQFFHGFRHGAIKRPIDKFFNQRIFDNLHGKSDREYEEIAYRTGEGDLTFNPVLVYGLYVHYLRKWVAKFGRNRILFLTLEEFSQQQDATIARTCDFLGLDHPPESLQLSKPHRGQYNADDEAVQQLMPRLQEFYELPNRKLFEEFGIQFGK